MCEINTMEEECAMFAVNGKGTAGVMNNGLTLHEKEERLEELKKLASALLPEKRWYKFSKRFVFCIVVLSVMWLLLYVALLELGVLKHWRA